MWKNCFPQHCQERVHIDERTGEKHIADVKADSGLVVEVQHSPIAEDEMQSRESFYGDMIWIVDARDLDGTSLWARRSTSPPAIRCRITFSGSAEARC